MNDSMDLATTRQNGESGLQVKTGEAVAEVQAAAVIAMNKPRDELASWERIGKSCQRPGFADGAEYQYNRGDSVVRGPSVKLAREMARCWGNIRYGIRVLTMTSEEVQIEGWAWDLETNTRVSSEARFARKVQRKQGDATVWVEADERNLRELIAKHGAIAVRNAILQLLPPDLVDKALRIARRTMSGSVQEKLEEDRDQVLAKVTGAWAAFDVSPAMLEKHVGKLMGDWDGEDVADLRSIYQSVRDGNTDVSEHFDVATKRAEDAKGELDAAAEKGDDPPPKKKKAKGAKKKKAKAADAEQPDLMDGGDDEA